jgi:hypothetical protein
LRARRIVFAPAYFWRRLAVPTKAFDSGITINAGIEGEDADDFLLLHGGEVNGAAGGETRMAENNLLGVLDGGLVDRENLIRHPQQGIECGLDEIRTADSDITMKNLLENSPICDPDARDR